MIDGKTIHEDGIVAEEVKNAPHLSFDPTLGAECSPALNHKALVIVHADSLKGIVRKDRVNDYDDYLKAVDKKKEFYLSSKDIVIIASYRMNWNERSPYEQEKNVLHLVTFNGHGKMANQFICGGIVYKQSMDSLTDLLRQKNVDSIEVIGEFGKGCAQEIKDLFSSHKFEAAMGKELFD